MMSSIVRNVASSKVLTGSSKNTANARQMAGYIRNRTAEISSIHHAVCHDSIDLRCRQHTDLRDEHDADAWLIQG